MGVVYLAVHPSLGRQMALKVMAKELAIDPDFVERFRREGEAAAKLRHPNIVQVFDFAHRDGVYFIAMEYLGAKTLKDLLQESGQQKVESACQMMDELLSALALAHSKGIVHRDIKPANVMLTDDGPVALTDFSIAHMKESSKLTQTGAIVGTPEYMAPEQFDGVWDGRSDLYSVGIVFYELLTGFSPFRSATMTEVMRKQLFTVPDPPSVVDFTVPEAISDIVSRALEKDPQNRFSSAEQMRSALAEALQGSVAGATPGGKESSTELGLPAATVASEVGVSKELPSALRTVSSGGEASKMASASTPLPGPSESSTSQESQEQKSPLLPQVATPSEGRPAWQFVLSGVVATVAVALIGLGVVEATPKPGDPPIAEATSTPSRSVATELPLPKPQVSPQPVSTPPKKKTEPPVTKKELFPQKAYIAPGVGVGDIGIGIGKAKVRSLWGEPDEGVSKNGLLQWGYGGKGDNAKCIVCFNKKGVVEAIAVFTPSFVIAGDPDSKVGASYSTVLANHPNPDLRADEGLNYANQGLLFIFKGGKCKALVVYGRNRNLTELQLMN